ncbi:MinD/ParA family protein [Streptomyces sp. TRM66268-LWL]|uniref:MinD/ParA family protein n=1 Tax=Streptomyces polyasparticus TaxID=2767826 RepID=A0ABR7SQ76_9ACTN|nr:AAA family ATPase [Streptomyces polyasparticus]MBC9717645.1 MinD/ParA family protein [Streptomyces polyasparticus]
MTIRILPAVGDADSARSLSTLLSQLPDTEPALPVTDSTALLDTLARLAGESLEELPEVVLVHERIGPVPALEVIREVAMRFPVVGVILITQDPSPSLFSASMDAGARGLIGLPLGYEELAARVQTAASWSMGVRPHLTQGPEAYTGPGGTVVTVTGAKGGVGTTLTAVQLALAARASGRSVALLDLDLQSGDVASYLDVQFRRSIVDLAGIPDINPRVLQDAVFTHPTGLGLLLAPGEGERGEDVTDRVARQAVSALRNRYEVVVVDCGTQMSSANAAAIEMADQAVLLVTPDVVAVRAAKRMVRMWDRLQIRKAEETLVVVNRHTRNTEIQPPLIERITGTRVARTAIPSHFKELQSAVDAGRMQDLDSRSTVKQALWGLAGELGLVRAQPPAKASRLTGDRGSLGLGRRRGRGGDEGSVTLEFAGMAPVIFAVIAILWQCVLYGYTYSLAGNAADEGARAGAVAAVRGDDPAAACDAAARENLPGAWQDSFTSGCTREGDLYKANVSVDVPLFFPGFDAGWSVDGEGGAVWEG